MGALRRFTAREEIREEKAAFIGALYLFTTFGALVFAARQHRRFIEMDADSATMKDYALLLMGFPPFSERSRTASIPDRGIERIIM